MHGALPALPKMPYQFALFKIALPEQSEWMPFHNNLSVNVLSQNALCNNNLPLRVEFQRSHILTNGQWKLGRGVRNRNSQNTGIAGMGGVWPLPVFLWRICPHALRALKGDHSSPKSDNFPTKVFLIPKKRSFNHIYLTFSLPNMIYALLWAKSLRSQPKIIP